MISVPGPLALETGEDPFYLIGEKSYHLETLQELPYYQWATVNCVDLPLPSDYKPSSRSVLIATNYGGIVLETGPEGQFKIVTQSSQRTLTSGIIRLYKLALPIVEESTVIGAIILPEPDVETMKLLHLLQKHRFSLSQYLGRSCISMKRNLISYDGIAVPESWSPCFKDPTTYNRANVILIDQDESGHERAAVASYNLTTGKLEAPLMMKL